MSGVRAEIDPRDQLDQRTLLRDVSWKQYQQLRRMRGERAVPRLTYLKGTIELMTPSRQHEFLKESLGRLFEAYAEEAGLDVNAFGSWMLDDESAESGAEPDKCYSLGESEKDRPDLVIEVIWTSGGVGKLEIYRRLGVPEVWFWERGLLQVHQLRRGRYAKARRSRVAPDFDLALLAKFALEPNQSMAVRDFRRALRQRRHVT
ncbi:MAG: Uma2 family endonuclease [Myxococcaceae bacterium]